MFDSTPIPGREQGPDRSFVPPSIALYLLSLVVDATRLKDRAKETRLVLERRTFQITTIRGLASLFSENNLEVVRGGRVVGRAAGGVATTSLPSTPGRSCLYAFVSMSCQPLYE